MVGVSLRKAALLKTLDVSFVPRGAFPAKHLTVFLVFLIIEGEFTVVTFALDDTSKQ